MPIPHRVLACLAASCLPVVATAHFPWLAPDAMQVAPGTPLTFEVAFGHGPEDVRSLETDRIADLVMLGADGGRWSIAAGGEATLIADDVGAAGVAVLAGRQKSGFWTRTPEGGKRLSRAEYPDGGECSYSSNGFKALVRVGDGEDGSVATGAVGHPLEIVPGALPSASGGASLPVRLLFDGAPLAADIAAVPLTDEGEAVTVATDADGRADLTLPAGRWMLHATHSTPYEDAAVCDENSYSATLVLERE